MLYDLHLINIIVVCFRDLKYGVVFPDFQGISYTFMIKQQLPASIYVDLDQLNDLKRLEKVCNYYHMQQL